jgi:ubiquinone/menaquinone biosynthesis C-methylase UbiE
MSDERYIEENKKWWDNVVVEHEKSSFYNNQTFKKEGISLMDIELPFLQNLKGKDVIHVQCHFGQDTVSLARMGAKSVTGTDISPNAIQIGQNMVNELGIKNVSFVDSNTLDLKRNISQKFDLAFMSYGVITWLPSIADLGDILNYLLRENGEVIIADFHPCLYMHDFDSGKIAFPYHNTGVNVEQEEGSYAFEGGKKQVTYFWSHSISEIIMGMIQNGFEIEVFNEYYYSPYNCFPNMKKIGDKKYEWRRGDHPLPHVFLLKSRLKF